MPAPRATNNAESNPVKSGSFSRRKFLQVSGALGAAGTLSACLPHTDPFAIAEDKAPVPGSDHWYLGEERQVATACGQCPVNCGIKVRVVQGRAVKINGNPECLLVGGKLGPKGQSGVFTLYDPDRIRGPMKRDGERGAGRWKPISWDQATAEVSQRLGALRTKGEPHKLAVLCGRQRGFMKEMLERFCRVYGTPNFFDPLSTGDGALVQAMEMGTGSAEIPGYDALKTSYILSLGSGIFESTCFGIHFARATGSFRRENPTRRSKIVQVEANESRTAEVADEWIRIRPGTYDVLALGLANQLLKDNLYDRDFVAAHTVGFEDFSALLNDYPADKVSRLTGIPEQDIYRLTIELSASRPAVVVVDSRSTATSNGLNIARCALALNAMLGSIERPGGMVVKKPLPLSAWAAEIHDAAAKAGLQQPALDGRMRDRFPFAASALDALPESVLAAKPYPTEALLLYYSNPLYAKNDPDRYRRAFEKIPFIVSFAPFLDESAFYSDLILPDHTYLERWEDATPPPFGFRAAIGIRRPAVDPLYDTQNSGDVLIQIAQAVGGAVASSFPWKDFQSAMEERLVGIAGAQRGTLKAESPADFMKKLTQVGYWQDDPLPAESWKEVFTTPSGKFEFRSQLAETRIKNWAAQKNQTPDQALAALGKPALATTLLPHAEEPRFAGSENDYPLLFIPYKPMTYSEGSGANIPYLKELSGLQRGLWATESWKSWVGIHPDTAGRLGVSQGDPVWVESPIGRLQCHALLSYTVPADLAVMELGAGHTQYGRFAQGKGANPRTISAPNFDPLSGNSVRCGTRVRIARA